MKARSSSSKGFSLPGVAFLLGKCFHVLCLFLASDFLHSNSLPLLSYTFLLLVGSSILFFAIQRAYLLLPLLTAKHIPPLAVNGSLLMLSLLLSSFGLAHSGPIRALLIECAAECISLLTWTGWERLSSMRRRGVVCIGIALLILMVTPEVSVHDLLTSPAATSMLPRVKQATGAVNAVDAGEFGVNAGIGPAGGEVPTPGIRSLLALPAASPLDLTAPSAASHSFTFLFLTLSESSVGTLSLIAASALTFLRKGYERKNAKEFGGRKGFHAVSSCAAAALLFIPMVVQLLMGGVGGVSAVVIDSGGGHELSVWWMLCTLIFLVLFLVVLQFYIDALAQHSDVQLLTKLNLVVSLLCAAAIDWYRQEQRMSVSTLVASLLVFLGIHFLLQPAASSVSDPSSALPVYTATSKTGKWRAVRAMFKHFMTDKTSFRIFTFLCINFCFMFVELLYGYFSNSLGLISDAGHMLFDCLPAGTRVSMSDGTSLPIEKVPVGASVLSRRAAESAGEEDGLVGMTVMAVLDRGVRPCVELVFSDGRTLTCTANHRILTAAGEWVEASKLVVGETEVAAGVDYPLVDSEAPAASVQDASVLDTDDESDDDNSSQNSDQDRYVERRDAGPLPLSRVKLVDRRPAETQRVYDLCVPNPQGDDSCSFVANGVLVHNCTALAIGLYASYISKTKGNSSMTYGYSRYETLSGYVNGVFLLFIGYFILVESIERLFTPPVIRGDSLVIVSALGLCVNLIGLTFFHDFSHGHGGGGHGHSHGGGHGHSHGGAAAEEEAEEAECDGDHHGHAHGGHGDGASEDAHGHDHHGHSHAAPATAAPSSSAASSAAPSHTNHNVMAIYLHILADTLGSIGVICSSLLIQIYGITSADAICSIIISLLIIGSTGPLLTSTLHILLTRTPPTKTKPLATALTTISSTIPHVRRIRDAHFWLLSDSEFVATAKVEVDGAAVDEQAVLQRVVEVLKGKKVGVNNLTVEIVREGEADGDTGGGVGSSASGGGGAGGLKPISVTNGSVSDA